MSDRRDFLRVMYEQMFRDIAQQYTIVWQAAGVVFASFALMALSEKDVLPIDLALAVVLIVLIWFLDNVIECSYWYNRNISIISNIERQFLERSDLREIHYYFEAIPKNNSMPAHIRVHGALGVGLGALIITYHFFSRVTPGFGLSLYYVDWVRAAPYAVALVGAIWLVARARRRSMDFDKFKQLSPGRVLP